MDTMNAKPVQNAVEVLAVYTSPDYDLWVEVPCCDYDGFKVLPAAIEFAGKTLGRTGWNSDRCRAYYSSGRTVAKAVK